MDRSIVEEEVAGTIDLRSELLQELEEVFAFDAAVFNHSMKPITMIIHCANNSLCWSLLVKLIECEILVQMRPSFLDNLSMVEDGLVNTNNSSTSSDRDLHLLLNLLEHLIILDLEVHLVRSPPTPPNLDRLPLDLLLLVEFSQESHRNFLTNRFLPLRIQ